MKKIALKSRGGEFKLGCLTFILILMGGCMIYGYFSQRSWNEALKSLPPEERAKIIQQQLEREHPQSNKEVQH